jgi:hypothetical protein
VLCGANETGFAARRRFDETLRCGQLELVFEFNVTVALFFVIAVVLTLVVMGDSFGRKN